MKGTDCKDLASCGSGPGPGPGAILVHDFLMRGGLTWVSQDLGPNGFLCSDLRLGEFSSVMLMSRTLVLRVVLDGFSLVVTSSVSPGSLELPPSCSLTPVSSSTPSSTC